MFPKNLKELQDLIIRIWRPSIDSLRKSKNDNLLFEDEGIPLGTRGEIVTVNFTGSGVTASDSGTTLTVNIPSGGGVTIVQTEIDFGNTTEYNTKLTVADPLILTTSTIIVNLSLTATTDHTQVDEIAISNVVVSAGNIINGVSFDIIGYCLQGTTGKYKVNYTINY